MRGIYRRGNIYWIAYKAGYQVIRESTGSSDRKLAVGVLDERRAEVFEGRWVGRARNVRTPLSEAIQEFMRESKDFVVDPEREKFFVTYNPMGFLKRV